MGGNLHFAQGPDIIGHFHDVLDLEFLDQFPRLVVAADFHEGAELGVDPDVNHFVAATAASRPIQPHFKTILATDVFLAFELGIGPVEEAQGEIFVGEIGASDGFAEFFSRKIQCFAVDEFKQIVFFVG